MSEDILRSRNRLKALRATRLLDSPQDGEFDQLTRLASHLLNVPNALVTLLSSDRQYVKSSANGDPESSHPVGSSQVLDESFCKHAITSGEPFTVEDAREHPLVRHTSAVVNGIVAYAGVPLESDGEAIGALCVIDSRPRIWSTEELETLRALARSATQLVKERTAMLRPRVDSLDEEPTELIECLLAHLDGLSDYEALLSQSILDLDAETKSRDNVMRSLARLRKAFEEDEGAADNEMRRLLGLYLGAEQQRSDAASAFAAGQVRLRELELCIAAQADALARLRVGVLDHGVSA